MSDYQSAHDQAVNNVSYHKPNHAVTQDCMGEIREAAINFIGVVCDNTRYCRETQMAYTDIESAVMNAIAGIARNEEATLADLKNRGLL